MNMRYSITLGGSFIWRLIFRGFIESTLEAVWSEVVPKEKMKVNQAQKVGEIIPGYQNVLHNGANMFHQRIFRDYEFLGASLVA